MEGENYNLVFFYRDSDQYLYTSKNVDMNKPVSKTNTPYIANSVKVILSPPTKWDILTGYKYDPLKYNPRIDSTLADGSNKGLSVELLEKPTSDNVYSVNIYDLPSSINNNHYTLKKIAGFKNIDSMPEFKKMLDATIQKGLNSYYDKDYKLYDYSFKSIDSRSESEASANVCLYNPPSYLELHNGNLQDPTIHGSVVAEILDYKNNINAPSLMNLNFQIDVSTNPFTIKKLGSKTIKIYNNYKIEK